MKYKFKVVIAFIFLSVSCSTNEKSNKLMLNADNLEMLRTVFFPSANISVLENEVIIDYGESLPDQEKVYFSNSSPDILYLIVANSIVHTSNLKGLDTLKIKIKRKVGNEEIGATVALDSAEISALRNAYLWNEEVRNAYAHILMNCSDNSIYSLVYSTTKITELSKDYAYDKSFWYLIHDFTNQVHDFQNFEQPNAIVNMWMVMQYGRIDNIEGSLECVEELFSLNGFNLKEKGLLDCSFKAFVVYINESVEKKVLD